MPKQPRLSKTLYVALFVKLANSDVQRRNFGQPTVVDLMQFHRADLDNAVFNANNYTVNAGFVISTPFLKPLSLFLIKIYTHLTS